MDPDSFGSADHDWESGSGSRGEEENMGGWRLKNENCAFFITHFFANCTFFAFLVINNLDQDPGYEFTKKPGSGSDSGSETL